ncbi:MAG: bile acid:sodium symporter [Burkholderiales bacterium]|nr:bile acid:sodium symporter [Burkholderiales bacterium]
MTMQQALSIVIVIYCVANLGSMGLELNLRETIKSLRSARLVLLALWWSWVVGPAFAYLLTRILPMAEPYAIGLLIFGLAPTAPALPLFVRMAHAEMSFAAALMPLAMVGTVVLMPLLAPLLIPGLSVSSWALAKPLLLTVLLPLVIGVAVRVYAARVADKLLPVFKRISGISTLLLLAFVVVLYGRELISALGSYAIAAQVLFILGMALVSYYFGFGLNQAQRSAMALGVCTRNGGAMFVAITAFPDLDPRLLAMILLAVPVPLITWVALAKFLGSRAVKTRVEGANETAIHEQ